MDDPSCISFSENIDESPNRKISGMGAIGMTERHNASKNNKTPHAAAADQSNKYP